MGARRDHRGDDSRRVLRGDGPHASRPVHRRDVPDLRLPRGAGRPVRQLRQPARPRRPHRATLEDRRRAAGLQGNLPPVPRPAGVRGAARELDRGAGSLASERPSLLTAARQGASPPAGDARPRLGSAHPGAGVRGARRQADLRLVRRRRRLPVRLRRVGGQPWDTRCLARVVAEPGCAALLLHGQGQHRLPQRHLAERADGVRRAAASSAQAGATSSCRTTSSRASS